MNYKEYFKGKKIAVIGLGPHGEMVADIKFLLRVKAKLWLYDMRSEKRFRGILSELKDAGLEKYTFGKVPGEELLNADLIIISPEISRKSNFLRPAFNAGMQIEFPDTLFLNLAPPITLIGVMGTCGKSTTCHLIYGILKKSFADYDDQGLFFIDPDSTNGALTHLKKIKKGDVVLACIPEKLMEYYCQMRISPHVVVITSLASFEKQELKNTFNILEFQTYNNFIVAPDEVIDAIKSQTNFISKAKMLRTRESSISDNLAMNMKSHHDLENVALAVQTSELFKVSHNMALNVIQDFVGLKGRIELVKKINGIEFYNDSFSITPKATLTALRTLSSSKDIILIFGGAYTGHNYDELINNISQYVKTIILLPGSGTLGLRHQIEILPEIKFIQVFSLEDAVKKARDNANKGDKILFSPGFDAVGIDVSRKERGERFVKAVRGL